MSTEELRALALAWQATDPDPATRAQTDALLAEGDPVALKESFGARLQFGTAGIRGRLGPGPGRMNRALVRRVSAGLGRYLDQVGAQGPVVIGRDGRHGSAEFAQESAQILGGLGRTVVCFDGVCSTPELAHAVTALGAAAGVMVTASHNPPQDNGYKVYWGNGAQIVPPHDRGISAAIDAVGDAADFARPSVAQLTAQGRFQGVPTAVSQDYLDRVLALRVHTGDPIAVVYTAMHGVGAAPLRRVMAAAGRAPLIEVPEQCAPDGDFPTVAFPNPEEPGALDLAMARANATGAELIVAHDPDADRLAVAVPDGQGGWAQLTGNQVGLLLADDLLRHGPQGPGRLVATTIVSTLLLQRVAQDHGALCTERLTGFKWIANAAIDHVPGHFVMGFEEALGYSVGDVVRDKDGISAALLMIDLAAWCKAQGKTLQQHLAALYGRVGFTSSRQISRKRPGAAGKAEIAGMMDRLRSATPAQLGGVAVAAVRDVQQGTRTDTATGAVTPLDLPASNVLAWDLTDGSRVLARPSGTEPKIKFYFEVLAALPEGAGLEQAEVAGQARIDALAADLLALADGAV